MNGIDALQRNSVGLLHMLGRFYSEARCWEDNGLLINVMGQTAAQFNGVLVLDPSVLTSDRIDQITEIFADEGLPFGVEICSTSAVPTCELLMVDHGYSRTISEPIMVCEGLLTLTSLKPDVQIRVLNGPEDAAHYKYVMMSAFEMPPYVPSDFFEVMLNLPASYPLLAWMDGQAVGSGMLFSSGGTASIYNVATVPTARRTGVATAMMSALHNHALADGHEGTVLVVQSEEGIALYKQLGYRQDGYRATYELV